MEEKIETKIKCPKCGTIIDVIGIKNAIAYRIITKIKEGIKSI